VIFKGSILYPIYKLFSSKTSIDQADSQLLIVI
jgi:hypothetical protein